MAMQPQTLQQIYARLIYKLEFLTFRPNKH